MWGIIWDTIGIPGVASLAFMLFWMGCEMLASHLAETTPARDDAQYAQYAQAEYLATIARGTDSYPTLY